MRFFPVFFLIFPLTLLSSGHKALYKFKFMVFDVGTVKYTFKVQGKSYKAYVAGKAEGIAAIISGGRKEYHRAILFRGMDGFLRASFYRTEVKKKNYVKIKEMLFRDGFVKVRYKKIKKRRIKLKEYTLKTKSICYDPISLFENLSLPGFFDKKPGSKFSFCVVTPSGKLSRIEGRVLGKNEKPPVPLRDDEKLVVLLTFFSHILPFKAGKIYLFFNEKMILKRACIKDVVLFGDLNVELLKWENL